MRRGPRESADIPRSRRSPPVLLAPSSDRARTRARGFSIPTLSERHSRTSSARVGRGRARERDVRLRRRRFFAIAPLAFAPAPRVHPTDSTVDELPRSDLRVLNPASQTRSFTVWYVRWTRRASTRIIDAGYVAIATRTSPRRSPRRLFFLFSPTDLSLSDRFDDDTEHARFVLVVLRR